MKIFKTIIENGIKYEVHESDSGDRYWYYKGKLHRENGPALEFSGGSKFWMKYNKYHREDGPALILRSGEEEYWLNDIYYPNVNSPEELLIASIII